MLTLDEMKPGQVFVIRLDVEKKTIAVSRLEGGREIPQNMTSAPGQLASTKPFDPDKLQMLASSLMDRGFMMTKTSSRHVNPQVFIAREIGKQPELAPRPRPDEEMDTPPVSTADYPVPLKTDPIGDTTREFDVPDHLLEQSKRGA